MEYNYYDAVCADVRDYIKENISLDEWKGRAEELETQLNDDLWVADSVTGNASGSYTFSTWKSEEYLAHNWGILEDALEEFGCSDVNPIEKGAEWCDVTIRCFYLPLAISDVLKEMGGELYSEGDEIAAC